MLETLKDTVYFVEKNSIALELEYNNALQEKDVLFTEVQNKKNWLVKKEKRVSFLNDLQMFTQEQNVGQYSTLLSAFVQDVLGKKKGVKLELYTSANMPALKIEAINGGKTEDIVNGCGGSISNITAAGIRLISLARLSNRKFIIMDEPECWTSNDNVEKFVKVIGTISKELNIQVVFISHHKWELFKEYGRVIKLEKDGDLIKPIVISDTAASYEGNYIESIRIKNGMSHMDTFIEFHPNLTCIIGENDIGKSVINTFFKAVAYNDSHDSFIKHDQNEAEVFISFDKNKRIEWKRVVKTNEENRQKVNYKLIDGDQEQSAYDSNNVPDFIEKALNIREVEGIDVHFVSQKEPLFILGSSFKPAQKAKILSLGQESVLVQKLMKKLKDKTKEVEDFVKKGEVSYAKDLKIISLLENFNFNEVNNIKKRIDAIEKQLVRKNELIDLINEYKQLKQISELEPISFDFTLPISKIDKINSLERMCKEMFELTMISEIEPVDFNIEFPKPKVNNLLVNLINNYKTLLEITKIEKIDFNIELPKSKNTAFFEGLLKEMFELKSKIENLNDKKIKIDLEKDKVFKQCEELAKEIGNLCPTCNNKFNAEDVFKGKVL